MPSTKLTLFCFPCAGASAMSYLHWRRLLPDGIDIRPVELPGRGSRIAEPFIRNFVALAAQLSEEIAEAQPQNYGFFGHSLGGLLAYACAQRLQGMQRQLPRAIFIVCCAAPSKRDEAGFASLTQDETLIERLRHLDGTPPEVFEHSDLLRLTLDTAAADFAVCASYRFEIQKPLEIPLFVFGGRDDEIAEEALAAWQKETTFPLALDMFDGGHFFMKQVEAAFLHRLQERLLESETMVEGRPAL